MEVVVASEETWAKLKYFKPENTTDNWGDPYAINDELLFMLDDFREFVAQPVLVTQGNGGRHSENSWHYVNRGSRAVDVVLPEWDGSSVDLLFAVFRFPFSGIGYYPHWRWHGTPVHGLHLDNRPLRWDRDGTHSYKWSRWMGIKDGGKKQRYVELNLSNLMKYPGGSNEISNGNMGLS